MVQDETMNDELLVKRKSEHGDFREQFVAVQDIKHVYARYDNYHHMDIVLRECLEMFALKLSRILTGEWNFEDHWDDLVGYAKLAQQRIKELNQAAAQATVSPQPWHNTNITASGGSSGLGSVYGKAAGKGNL